MSRKIVIIGAGAHGREVAGILQDEAVSEVLGFIDDDPGLRNQCVLNLPVLGGWEWFNSVKKNEIAVICASGFSHVRQKMVQKTQTLNLPFAKAISSASYISSHALIGQGVVVYPQAYVGSGSVLADHVVVNANAVISHDTKINRFGTINPGVNLAGGVNVGEGCYIGIGASVIQGIKIGSWTTVGAGAVVIRDLPDGTTAVGVPAYIIKTKEEN